MRFTSNDPFKGKFENPLTLHQYLYCTNDTVNGVDLDGKWAVSIGGSLSGTTSSGLLQGASNSGIASLSKGGLGIHAAARQALIMLQVMEVDAGLGGTFGGSVVIGKGDEGGMFWGLMGFVGGGASISNGPGWSGTIDIGYSPNAQSMQHLEGGYTEYGASVISTAPTGNPFFGIAGGLSYSIGDGADGAQLWTGSIGTGSWGWKTGWEGHAYRGYAWVKEF